VRFGIKARVETRAQPSVVTSPEKPPLSQCRIRPLSQPPAPAGPIAHNVDYVKFAYYLEWAAGVETDY
jgi:hypothetical protein